MEICRCCHLLALLYDPLVLSLQVRRCSDVASLFLREGLHVVLELLDRDLGIGSGLLLRLDYLVQLAKLCIEPRQGCALFLQPALRLAVLRLLL